MGPEKDLVRMFADAVRKGGLKLGFYYSFADWHHQDYPGAYYRDWPDAWKDEESRLRFVKYYQAQLKELMTQYGKVDILWYDGCIPAPTDGKEINEYII
jgi:alpha-L-fucosidase